MKLITGTIQHEFRMAQGQRAGEYQETRLDFSFAEHMAKDPLGVVIYDRYENGEHRHHAIAMVGETSLVLVHIPRSRQ
jgi:uncharacterized DUF497 family protein